MKVPELYVNEVVILIEALDRKADAICDSIKKRRRTVDIQMFLFPWAMRSIATAFIVESKVALEVLNVMQELRNKLMESTGVDEDMQKVTLSQILEKNRESSTS